MDFIEIQGNTCVGADEPIEVTPLKGNKKKRIIHDFLIQNMWKRTTTVFAITLAALGSKGKSEIVYISEGEWNRISEIVLRRKKLPPYVSQGILDDLGITREEYLEKFPKRKKEN